MTIEITYWECDATDNKSPINKLAYLEWTENGKSYFGYGDESKFNHGEECPLDEIHNPTGHTETRGIPNHVRLHLAKIIAGPAWKPEWK